MSRSFHDTIHLVKQISTFHCSWLLSLKTENENATCPNQQGQLCYLGAVVFSHDPIGINICRNRDQNLIGWIQ